MTTIAKPVLAPKLVSELLAIGVQASVSVDSAGNTSYRVDSMGAATQAQIDNVIANHAATPVATPADKAVTNIQQAIQAAGGFDKLTAAQKDNLLRWMVQHMIGQTV